MLAIEITYLLLLMEQMSLVMEDWLTQMPPHTPLSNPLLHVIHERLCQHICLGDKTPKERDSCMNAEEH